MPISITHREGGGYSVDTDGTPHAFTDAAAMRTFVEMYQAISAAYPAVVFTLADDATVVEWHRPGPRPDFAQVRADYLAAQDRQRSDAAALRTRVRSAAQSAVGVQFDALSALQVRALIAIMLYKQGAIDSTGAVRPLADWEG